ncbi:hypothetical protein NQZ79_g1513 [Umbelopsis isabellina]|nr:hypothetical protein NQZ79_g1513 [Umbelopsis isabellina]
MDSFLYLRESGFDAENQPAQQPNQEQQTSTYMEDQKPSWSEHDTLGALQEQHDVTSYLLPLESEDWSLLHQNEFLALAPSGEDATIASATDGASHANFVTPDMLHRPHSNLESKEIPTQQPEHNIINDETRMTTRSKTKKPDPTKDDTAEETQPKPNDTAEQKKKPQKSKKLYCICQQPYDGNPMVQCDSCREWFHCSCVNLDPDEAEDIDWTCDSCPKIAGKVKAKVCSALNCATRSPVMPTAVSAGACITVIAFNGVTANIYFKHIFESYLLSTISQYLARWQYVKNLAKRDREASAEWAGSDEEEDEELPESPKRRERLKSSTPGKCLLISCSKSARPESLFCSEKCATDHVNEKATTRRKWRATQSPESSAARSPIVKESSKKKQPSSASPQLVANENDPIRRNVTKSLAATLKVLIEAALKNDPTLFNPDDDVNSVLETSIAADSDKVEDNGATTTEKEGTARLEKASEKAVTASPPSAMHIAEKLAADIETAMFQHLAEPHPKFPTSKPQTCGEKYKGKFRSLLYNLKDKANEIFQLRVITGDLNPENLVSMSGEDMANPELKSMSESLRQKSFKKILY